MKQRGHQDADGWRVGRGWVVARSRATTQLLPHGTSSSYIVLLLSSSSSSYLLLLILLLLLWNLLEAS